MDIFNQTIDIYLNVLGKQVPAEFLTSLLSRNQISQFQAVQGDKVRVRLWLCKPVIQAGQPHALSRANGPIVMSVKLSAADDETLAINSYFTLNDEGNGEHYVGIMDYDTEQIRTALGPSKLSIPARMDIELQMEGNKQRMTFQRDIMIYREVYRGTETPPNVAGETYPPPGTLASNVSLQALALWMRKVQQGDFVWFNQETTTWHAVKLVGQPGHETLQIGPGYDSPDSVPIVDPLEIPVAPGAITKPATGQGFSVTVEMAAAVAWITPGSLVNIASKGRAQVVKIDGVTVSLMAIQHDFTADIAVGDKMLVLQIGGAPGPKGKDGGIVAEERLRVVETNALALGGFWQGELPDYGLRTREPLYVEGCTFLWELKTSGSFLMSSTIDDEGGFSLGLHGDNGALYLYRKAYTILQWLDFTDYRNNWLRLGIYFSSTELVLFVHGMEKHIPLESPDAFALMKYLGSYQSHNFKGNLKRLTAYNYRLTSEQVKAWGDYGVSVEDKDGRMLSSGWVNGREGFGFWDTFNIGTASLEINSTNGGAGCKLPFGKVFLAGTIIRFEADVEAITGDIRLSFFQSGVGDTPIEFLAGQSIINAHGHVIYEVKLLAGADQFALVTYTPNTSAKIKNILLRINGAFVDYKPDACAEKRWKDAGLGCVDMISFAGDLTRAMSSQVKQRAFPVSWPSVTVPVQSTQTITLDGAALASPAISAVRAGDALTFSPNATALPAGIMIAGVQAKNDGTATLTLANVKASAVTTGIITGTLTHTIS